MTKSAFVTGSSGQDGSYLCALLLKKGYKVFAGTRRSSNGIPHRLNELGIADDVEFVPFDLTELPSILSVIDRTQPDEFYNLAAQSFVGLSWEQPLAVTDIDAVGVTRILEAIRRFSPHTRFYQASTSEMFGSVKAAPQSETTPFCPRSPYGVSKLYGHWIAVNYRESHGLHTSSGILFNHESPLRGHEFVTRKITLKLAQIAHGVGDVLELGNLDVQRDWGYAADYVQGMWSMLQQDAGDDYVLATGVTTTVRAFVEKAGRAMGVELAWEGTGTDEIGRDARTGKTLVRINPKYLRPSEVWLLQGDAAKAREKLGWKTTLDIDELATMMAKADYDRVARDRVMF